MYEYDWQLPDDGIPLKELIFDKHECYYDYDAILICIVIRYLLNSTKHWLIEITALLAGCQLKLTALELCKAFDWLCNYCLGVICNVTLL